MRSRRSPGVKPGMSLGSYDIHETRSDAGLSKMGRLCRCSFMPVMEYLWGYSPGKVDYLHDEPGLSSSAVIRSSRQGPDCPSAGLSSDLKLASVVTPRLPCDRALR